jgi:hypothetical protein
MGTSFHTCCRSRPSFKREVDASKNATYTPSDDAIISAYDFAGAGLLVAVGDGNASLVVRLLLANPCLKAVIHDLDGVNPDVATLIRDKSLEHRCAITPGGADGPFPAADTFLLRGIVHYWDDPYALSILQRCRAALRLGGRLLLAEMLMPPGNQMFVGKFIDIESMLLTHGGRERSETEYRALLEAAGFIVTAVVRTAAPISMIEARHRAAS